MRTMQKLPEEKQEGQGLPADNGYKCKFKINSDLYSVRLSSARVTLRQQLVARNPTRKAAIAPSLQT